jgi:SAM-dependent methyltransferase
MDVNARLRSIARHARDRLDAYSGPPAPFPTALPRPVPPGWTEQQLREVMNTFALDNAEPGQMAGYVDDAFWRFLHTWGCVAGESGRALELGANPYFMSYLLEEHTPLDVTLANFFGPEFPEKTSLTQELTWTDRDGVQHVQKRTSDLFNIEEDRYPYDDDAFDVVLFCEIIEHLLMDPMHSLAEIHRVLKPGGLLVVTTPNVARLENVIRLVLGENIYDPYSGFGPYGRHNREYTQHDLVVLLKFCGFSIEHHFTADAHPASFDDRPSYKQIAREIRFRQNDLGQYLFVKARATAEPQPGRPDFLFRNF